MPLLRCVLHQVDPGTESKGPLPSLASKAGRRRALLLCTGDTSLHLLIALIADRGEVGKRCPGTRPSFLV